MVVLIKDTLSSLPIRLMQSVKLPQSILLSIDKLVRFFLWGGSNSKSKLHYVNWNTNTQPLVAYNGLGMNRNLSLMNLA